MTALPASTVEWSPSTTPAAPNASKATTGVIPGDFLPASDYNWILKFLSELSNANTENFYHSSVTLPTGLISGALTGVGDHLTDGKHEQVRIADFTLSESSGSISAQLNSGSDETLTVSNAGAGEVTLSVEGSAQSTGAGSITAKHGGIVTVEEADSSPAYTNSTTPTALRAQTILANTLAVGDVLTYRASTVITAWAAGTLTSAFLFDGVSKASESTSNAGDLAVFEIDITVRSLGVSGEVSISRKSWTTTAAATSSTFRTSETLQTVDTTGPIAVQLRGTWSVADPGSSAVSRRWQIDKFYA